MGQRLNQRKSEPSTHREKEKRRKGEEESAYGCSPLLLFSSSPLLAS
jgi:hypothetical protein